MSKNVGNRFAGHSCSKEADRPRVPENVGTTLSERAYSCGGKALAYGCLNAVPLTQTAKRRIYPKK